MNRSSAPLVALALVGASAPAASAQTSPYFLTAGDQNRISVAQGFSTILQWSEARSAEYPIAAWGDIRTTGIGSGQQGTQYNLTGGVIGGPLSHSISGDFYDSTSDGTHNYLVEFSSGNVYSTDRNYQNASFMFSTGENNLGITWDPTTNNLWVSNWAGSMVREYSMSGSLVSSFSTGHSENAALAYDPADDTLWLHDRSAQGTYEWYTKSGQLLYRGGLGGVGSDNVLGGEMDIGIPAPGSLALLGLGGLAAARRRRA